MVLPVDVWRDTLLLGLRSKNWNDDDRRRRLLPSAYEPGLLRRIEVTKRILVVDDKNELLHLMRRVLEDEQYQVSILQDGKDAYTRVKTQLPDLLILDLKLGDISGQDILKQLKDDHVTADIPFIVFTAGLLQCGEVTKLVSKQPGDHKAA